MDFISELKIELNKAFTENGDSAFHSSGSYCLDFFALIGGKRGQYSEAMSLFAKAFFEDKLLAIKLLFYTRDIRGGLGERASFRICLNYLGNFYSSIARQLISFIPKYGRFDDLLSLLYTPVEEDVASFIKKQLDEDCKNDADGKDISLLSKWLPSINASSEESRSLARRLCSLLKMSYESYRKMLSKLRKGRILENNLRLLDYSFDYEKIPSNASIMYMDTFLKRDNVRYNDFLNKVKEGKAKVNTSVLFPYKVIQKLNRNTLSPDEINALNLTWKSFDRTEYDSNTIVVRDGSGSMYWSSEDGVIPNDVATALTILMAEQLKGPYKNTFISFSENPKLVTISGNNIYDDYQKVISYDEIANTNISKVYSLILRVAVKNKVPKDQMIKRVIIISDMEFDEGVTGVSTFESFKQKFKMCDYDMPELVFWNVASRKTHVPVLMNEHNVKLVSGASDKIFDLVMKDGLYNPYDFMIECLEKYREFNSLVLE